MAAITDLSNLLNLATGGSSGTPQTAWFQKVSRLDGKTPTALIAGRMASLWRYDGVNWPSGRLPGAATATTKSTQGALQGWTDPGGGREKHIIQAFGTGLVGGTLILYDRLLDCGGDGVTLSNTVGGSITRNTSGAGNFAFLEVNNTIGVTGRTVTMSYVDQDGNTAETSPEQRVGATGFREVSRAIMLPINSPDSGIRSVASFTLSGSTGTAGDLDLVIGKPIAYLGLGAPGAPAWRDFTTGMPGIPTIEAGACIAALWSPSTTTVPEFFGGISMVEA